MCHQPDLGPNSDEQAPRASAALAIQPLFLPFFMLVVLSVGLAHIDASAHQCLSQTRTRPGLSGPEALHRPFGSAVRVHNRAILTPSERQKITDVFSDSTIPSEMKTMKALQLYLSTRLAMVPTEEQAAALIQTLTLPVDFNRRGLTEVNSDLVNYPEALRNNPILLSSLVHEIEHRIQFVQIRNLNRVGDPNAFRYARALWFVLALKFGVQTKFLMERDAIGAEWEVLHSMPKEIRDASRAAIEGTPFTDQRMKALFLRTLSSAHLTRDEYIRSEHRAGRYSRASIALESGVNMARSSYAMAKMASLLYVISLLFQGDDTEANSGD